MSKTKQWREAITNAGVLVTPEDRKRSINSAIAFCGVALVRLPSGENLITEAMVLEAGRYLDVVRRASTDPYVPDKDERKDVLNNCRDEDAETLLMEAIENLVEISSTATCCDALFIRDTDALLQAAWEKVHDDRK